jgi:Flp pilus assembly pilin Flp
VTDGHTAAAAPPLRNNDFAVLILNLDPEALPMKRLLGMWREQDGVLSFEWTLLLTLLTIGIVGGLAAARDAIIDELGDVAEAAQGIDQSFSLAAQMIDFDGDGTIDFTTNASSFTEISGVDNVFTDCDRSTFPIGQGPVDDVDS